MEFREATVSQKWDPLPRLTLADGRSMELAPVPKNGNCGFQAIAWGLMHVDILQGDEAYSLNVRQKLANHVTEDGEFYASKLVEFGMVDTSDCEEGEERSRAFECIEDFKDGVLREGLDGHWLGESFGSLELLALARVYGVKIEVYTYCTRSDSVKMYQETGKGSQTVSLLFSGECASGHFDLLGRDSRRSERLREWWKRVRAETPAKCKRVFEVLRKAQCKPLLTAISAAVKAATSRIELCQLVTSILYCLCLGSCCMGEAWLLAVPLRPCAQKYSNPSFGRR